MDRKDFQFLENNNKIDEYCLKTLCDTFLNSNFSTYAYNDPFELFPKKHWKDISSFNRYAIVIIPRRQTVVKMFDSFVLNYILHIKNLHKKTWFTDPCEKRSPLLKRDARNTLHNSNLKRVDHPSASDFFRGIVWNY